MSVVFVSVLAIVHVILDYIRGVMVSVSVLIFFSIDRYQLQLSHCLSRHCFNLPFFVCLSVIGQI